MMSQRLTGLILVVFSLNSYSQVTSDTLIVEYNNDTYVRSNMATTNFNTDINMFFYIASTQKYRAFVQFDLTSIPENAIITSSKLVLTPAWINNAADHPAYLSRVSASWDGTTMTWNNQPGIYTSDQISITHAQTSSYVPHEFTVTNHVQQMVNYPELNFGWCLRLQSEATPNRGVQYRTSATDSVHWHPYLIVNYVLPVEINGLVNHCSSGEENGAINPNIEGGSGTYSSYEWFHYDMGTVSSIESGTNMANVSIDSLEDGLYLFTALDNAGRRGYKYFLVGEYGASTTVEFRDNSSTTNSELFNEDANPVFTISTSDGNVVSGSSTAFTAYNSTATYNSSLLKYQVDFDSLFEISVADLRLNSYGHYRKASPVTTDSGYVSRVTSDWYESTVTWNSKPSTTTADRQLIPPTAPGITVTRHDTIDLIPFVEYWQTNPDQNYGVDLSLTRYAQPDNAYLQYRSYDFGTAMRRPRLRMTYSLPEQVTTDFVDSLGTGSISVLAPNGELPYKYLISTLDTLPVLDTIWYAIKDSIPVDSASFYQGQFNSHFHRFENLPADRYFIGVYDNNGDKIFDHQVYVKPSLRLADTNDVIIDGDTIFVDYPSSSSARVVYFDVISMLEDGGMEIEVTQLDDDIIVGFNNMQEPKVVYEADFEYAVKIESSGDVTFLRDGISLRTATAIVGDQFRLIKEGNHINFYKNGVLEFGDAIRTTQLDDFKTEIHLKGPGSSLVSKPVGLVKPKPKYDVVNSICGENLGTITIQAGNYHGYYNYFYSLVNTLTSEVFLSGPIGASPIIIQDVPVGIYTLTTYWSNGFHSIPSLTEVVVGYYLNWVDLDDASVGSYPFYILSATSNPGTARSLNAVEHDQPYWLQFIPKTTMPGMAQFLYFDIKNYEDDLEARIWILNFLGLKIAVTYSSLGPEALEPGVPTLVWPNTAQLIGNDPIRILHDSGEITVRYQNTNLVVFDSSVDGIVSADVELTNGITIVNGLASFCYPIASPYVKLRRIIDGGHYLANEGILNVEYDEEYNDDELEFYVYQESGNDEVGESAWTVSPISYGDNRLSFSFTDTTCLANGYYILEIVNKKKEKRYLRFKIVNSTC